MSLMPLKKLALIAQVSAGFNFAFANNWQAQLKYAHNFYNNTSSSKFVSILRTTRLYTCAYFISNCYCHHRHRRHQYHSPHHHHLAHQHQCL